MTGRIRVGTASWTDRTLVQESEFYPRRSMSAEERLRFYAERFDLVEVDATYYYPPTHDLTGKWATRSPDGFVFDVKAYSLLTQHPTRRDSLWEDVRAELADDGKERVYLDHLPPEVAARAFAHFREALRPLESAGKLGAVFLQFPPWFRPSRSSRRYLRSLPERLPGLDLAVEFRHSSWMQGEDADRTLRLLEELGIAYTVVDEPQGFDTSVPPVVASTTDRLAVLRLHGHNRENWERSGISPAERFRYLYSEEELDGWVPRVRELAAGARETHVLFNNCYRDYGVRNARRLAEMLGVAADGR